MFIFIFIFIFFYQRTLGTGWQTVKEETENISKKHGDLGEFLTFQVEEPLLNFLKETKKPRSTV